MVVIIVVINSSSNEVVTDNGNHNDNGNHSNNGSTNKVCHQCRMVACAERSPPSPP